MVRIHPSLSPQQLLVIVDYEANQYIRFLFILQTLWQGSPRRGLSASVTKLNLLSSLCHEVGHLGSGHATG